MNNWQPIETAPKDGSTFITYSPPPFADGECTIDTAGWLIDTGEFWKGGCGFQYVTHWMQLLSPNETSMNTEQARKQERGEEIIHCEKCLYFSGPFLTRSVFGGGKSSGWGRCCINPQSIAKQKASFCGKGKLKNG